MKTRLKIFLKWRLEISDAVIKQEILVDGETMIDFLTNYK